MIDVNELQKDLAACGDNPTKVRFVLTLVEKSTDVPERALLWAVIHGIATASLLSYGSDPQQALDGAMAGAAMRNGSFQGPLDVVRPKAQG